jgi:murein DD-endopeptidase MepM/ murein hydrolase activator NlpD
MKISLFLKSYAIKAYSFALLVPIIASVPTQANASFFSDIVSSFIGQNTQAADVETTNFGTDFSEFNSQNMQVLGTTSVDPNTKNVGDGSNVTIVEEGALLPDNGLIGSGLENTSSGEMTTYEVQPGDTLSEIAELHDVSVNTIRWENNISGQNIKIGQKLNILPVTGVKHIIKKGDNLDKIAAKYDADVEDILVFNDITRSSTLVTGEILYIPNGIIKDVEVVKKTVTPGNKTTPHPDTSPIVISSGYYTRPANGPTTSSYGSRKGSFHYGIDIGNSRGTPVVAAADGVVVGSLNSCAEGRSSCGGRYGNYILIQHSNGTTTRYAHLSKVTVSVGQEVDKGEPIGKIGNTGRSTGPHLHFQIEKSNGSTIRPAF